MGGRNLRKNSDRRFCDSFEQRQRCVQSLDTPRLKLGRLRSTCKGSRRTGERARRSSFEYVVMVKTRLSARGWSSRRRSSRAGTKRRGSSGFRRLCAPHRQQLYRRTQIQLAVLAIGVKLVEV